LPGIPLFSEERKELAMDQQTKAAILNVHELLVEVLQICELSVANVPPIKTKLEMLEKVEECRQHLEQASEELGLL
jgi:hypothetical protein